MGGSEKKKHHLWKVMAYLSWRTFEEGGWMCCGRWGWGGGVSCGASLLMGRKSERREARGSDWVSVTRVGALAP